MPRIRDCACSRRSDTSCGRMTDRWNEARSSSNYLDRVSENSPPLNPADQTDPETMEAWGCQVVEEDADFMGTNASCVPPPDSSNVHVASPIGSANNQDTFSPIGSPFSSMEAPQSKSSPPFYLLFQRSSAWSRFQNAQ